jgi:hypothetical protein
VTNSEARNQAISDAIQNPARSPGVIRAFSSRSLTTYQNLLPADSEARSFGIELCDGVFRHSEFGSEPVDFDRAEGCVGVGLVRSRLIREDHLRGAGEGSDMDASFDALRDTGLHLQPLLLDQRAKATRSGDLEAVERLTEQFRHLQLKATILLNLFWAPNGPLRSNPYDVVYASFFEARFLVGRHQRR